MQYWPLQLLSMTNTKITSSRYDRKAKGRVGKLQRNDLLHAVETVEEAFVDAVRDEVKLLFCGKDHSSTSSEGRNVVQVSRVTSQDNMSRRRNHGWGLNQ